MASDAQDQTQALTGKLTLGLTLWLGAVAIACYFSPDLALFALAATVIGAYMVFETTHRKEGDAQFSEALHTLKREHNLIIQDVARTKADIEEIKQAEEIKKPFKPAPAPAATPAVAKAEEPLQKLRATKPIAANQDPYTEMLGLSDTVVKELVQHAVGSQRIDVFLQPVMRLPQRKMRFFEMYARVRARAGEYIPAQRFMGVTDKETISEIDNLLLLRCLRIVKNTAHLSRAAPFFINIASATLKNARFMESLLTFVARNRELANRLIFEMRQEDFDGLGPQLLQLIAALSKTGCSFSIDHVSHADIDASKLLQYRVKFVKIEAAWLIGQAKAGEARIAEINRFKRKLEANGIGVIVEKIENEAMMKQLLDFDVHFGQGFLFGKPELEGAYRQGKVA